MAAEEPGTEPLHEPVWKSSCGGETAKERLPESAGRLGRFLLGRSCSWGACSNAAGAPSRYREVDGSPRVHAELVLGDREWIGRNRGRRLMRQVVAGEKPHVHRRAGTTAVGRAAHVEGDGRLDGPPARLLGRVRTKANVGDGDMAAPMSGTTAS